MAFTPYTGAAPVTKFLIKGLHGYKDISIEFAGSATIIVADNGVGKTTILNALNAFLSRRLHRLNSINFSSIECTFHGELFPIILHKWQLGSLVGENDPVEAFATKFSLDENELRDFLSSTTLKEAFTAKRHPLIMRIYNSSQIPMSRLEDEIIDLYKNLDSSLDESTREISEHIRSKTGNFKILYLPTYRRIERPLLRPSKRPVRPPRPASSSSLAPSDIAYGLADVEQQLAELSEEIERRSNFEYRSLSTRMLDELMKGRAKQDKITIAELPDLQSLSRFLNRVGQQSVGAQVFQEIEKLYNNEEITTNENSFLRYFLSRLKSVIEQTQEMEQKVERFVDVCNSYLTFSSDEKKLAFDPQTLRVVVQDLWADTPISLDDLSSGEKQIVSLMAHLYLGSGKLLVLMDEPELSLSIDWQKKVLPDIMKSGAVVQMLAITHSPFIFENELDEYAKPLSIQRNEVKKHAD